MNPDTIRAAGKVVAAAVLVGIGILGLTVPPVLSLGHDLSAGLLGSGLTLLGVSSVPGSNAVVTKLATKEPPPQPAG